jgi:hypothetical protein
MKRGNKNVKTKSYITQIIWIMNTYYCDMAPESRNMEARARRPLLDNGSVIIFPLQQIAVNVSLLR